MSGTRNILNSFGRSNRLININNALRLWYQGEVVHHGTAVGNSIGRENKVFAAVRESLFVPREFDDFHRFFKSFAVDAIMFGRHGVVARGNNCAKAPCFAGNSSTTYANFHAPTRDDVGQSEVFSQAQRVPLRYHVEHLSEAEVFGESGKMHAKQNEVGKNFVALKLEVMFGEPHRVVAECIGSL